MGVGAVVYINVNISNNVKMLRSVLVVAIIMFNGIKKAQKTNSFLPFLPAVLRQSVYVLTLSFLKCHV